MKKLAWRTLLVLVVLGSAVALVATRPARLGLDLRGGTQIVLQAQDTPQQQVDDDTVDRTLEVLRRRVDQLGVSEPNLQRSGADRVIIELPGLSDPDDAIEVIGKTAQLAFHPVLGPASPVDPANPQPVADGEIVLPDEDGAPLRLGPASVTGNDVADARPTLGGSVGTEWQVKVDFRAGGNSWAELTGQAACFPAGNPQRRVAIVLDNTVVLSPQVDPGVRCQEGLTGGTTVITGNYTEDEASDTALLIRAGALPVPVEIIERRTVGPTLGDAAIKASVQAAIIGATLTILYMLFYYRLLGALASIALLSYGAIAYAVLLALGATLTLPGIAGFVLAIGMAVDANVLVFERMKEEHAGGASVRGAARNGFSKAWTAIADSNATTVIAAVLLFFLASGAVRGFGITLTVGVAVSLFTALVVTRLLVDLVLRRKSLVAKPKLLGLEVGGGFRQRLLERRPKVVHGYPKWLTISAVVMVLCIGGLFVRGLNYGIEFSGGTLTEFDPRGEVSLDDVRDAVVSAGFPRAVVQASGNANVVVRTEQLSLEQEDTLKNAVDSVAGDSTVVREEFIGPTIGNELRRKALIALGLALGAQLLYLAVRFRWSYAAAAVAAMFHDLLILLGVFAWMGKSVDGVFVAALLTVVGYSINDSVVVFDRIRELRRARPREPLVDVANEACLQTVPRTINTGLGALFILFALYFLGGETLTDFAFALLIGILVGTYSSVFTAAPIAVILEGWAGRRRPQAPEKKIGARPAGGPARPTRPAPAGAQRPRKKVARS